jgi:hypothetical protein
LLRLIGKLEDEARTGEILAAAGLAGDPRGGIGGLHAASALGLCHACSGGRRTLLWRPGPRRQDERPPKLAREAEYRRVLEVLRSEPRAAFPTGYLEDVAGRRTRQEVMGAMKLFVAARLVEHVVCRPRTQYHRITCWGWSSPEIKERDRYYRAGEEAREPLSLDASPGDRGTIADFDRARRGV